ncbi:MAG: hypothetical protein F6K40_25715 [Okeania sp. SIO3I5]|uniref:hypothetical protein n=1 Tax=Okeania sp. SIO3I5 TaxID=2607805 RepID=UPI0013B61E9F|nr:hypothetical protein [Okeania sp. SIO3I5]NEQ39469.1 hypothetical protein [Okeania sp. SIO3I5]
MMKRLFDFLDLPNFQTRKLSNFFLPGNQKLEQDSQTKFNWETRNGERQISRITAR